MNSASELDALRDRAILSSLAGFPFLLVFAAAWTAGGALSYIVPREVVPWVYVLLGVPAAPIAMALERRLGYAPPPEPDPLLPLTLQILFIQVVAFPAILLVWDAAPEYVPVAFAAVVGGHFLPFQWVYRTTLYGYLGVVVAIGPLVLAIIFGHKAMHYTGFFVGAALLVGALVARSHARGTWQRVGQTAQQSLAATTLSSVAEPK
jgi:hypothetical protein